MWQFTVPSLYLFRHVVGWTAGTNEYGFLLPFLLLLCKGKNGLNGFEDEIEFE